MRHYGRNCATEKVVRLCQILLQAGFAVNGKKVCSWTLLAAALQLFLTGGCSIIGFGISSAIESAQPTTFEEVPVQQMQSLQRGKDLYITLNNGNFTNGNFRGFDTMPEEEYSEIYASKLGRGLADVGLPSLGDMITITDNHGKRQTFAFLGFGYEGHPYILLRPFQESRSDQVNLDVINKAENNRGREIEVATLRRLLAEGHIPLLTVISVEDEEGMTTRIPIHNISKIEKRSKDYSIKPVVFMVGLAIDIVIAIKILEDFHIGS